MFNNLRETIKALNADVNNVANSEKAKKLRSKLLKIGIPLAVCGFLGVFGSGIELYLYFSMGVYCRVQVAYRDCHESLFVT